jgi:hypothetical protein
MLLNHIIELAHLLIPLFVAHYLSEPTKLVGMLFCCATLIQRSDSRKWRLGCALPHIGMRWDLVVPQVMRVVLRLSAR